MMTPFHRYYFSGCRRGTDGPVMKSAGRLRGKMQEALLSAQNRGHVLVVGESGSQRGAAHKIFASFFLKEKKAESVWRKEALRGRLGVFYIHQYSRFSHTIRRDGELFSATAAPGFL
jgi:hypothetical protein